MAKKKQRTKAVSHGQRDGRTPRKVVHQPCGASSNVEGADLRRVCDPYVDSTGPRCETCDHEFPFAEFVWKDTGESVRVFRQRMRSLIPESHNTLHERAAQFVMLLSVVLAGCVIWFVPGILWKVLLVPAAIAGTFVIGSITIDFVLHKVIGSVDPQIEV